MRYPNPTWFAANGAAVGGSVHLDMPEMGAVGDAMVLAIDPCPELENGPGRLVTAWYRHWRDDAWDLAVEGEPASIGVTAFHPIRSADRALWIAAGQLPPGERLLAADGSTPRVLGVSPRERVEPVFNLEVEGDRCYRVGEQGLRMPIQRG